MTAAGFARKVDVVVGGRATLQAARAIAREPHPRHGLLLDAFKLSEPRMVRDVTRAADRGHVGVLLDPEFSGQQSRSTLARHGATLVEYGDLPAKNHAKSIVGRRGMVGSVPLTPAAPLRLDFGVLLDRKGTDALRGVLLAGLGRDRGAIRSAALTARHEGILLSDPLNGVAHLSNLVDGELRSSSSLLIASKRTEDARSVKSMARAARDGADVTLLTKDIERATRQRLEKAGVDVRVMTTLHGNAMVFDGKRAYVGSAYLHERSLGRDGRPTRELGVVTNDRGAVRDIEVALGARTGGSAWQRLRGALEDAARDAAAQLDAR